MPGLKKTVFISLVVMGLSCCTQDLRFIEAGGTWFSDQESNQGPLHWEPGASATGPPGKSLCLALSSHISWWSIHVTEHVSTRPFSSFS